MSLGGVAIALDSLTCNCEKTATKKPKLSLFPNSIKDLFPAKVLVLALSKLNAGCTRACLATAVVEWWILYDWEMPWRALLTTVSPLRVPSEDSFLLKTIGKAFGCMLSVSSTLHTFTFFHPCATRSLHPGCSHRVAEGDQATSWKSASTKEKTVHPKHRMFTHYFYFFCVSWRNACASHLYCASSANSLSLWCVCSMVTYHLVKAHHCELLMQNSRHLKEQSLEIHEARWNQHLLAHSPVLTGILPSREVAPDFTSSVPECRPHKNTLAVTNH